MSVIDDYLVRFSEAERYEMNRIRTIAHRLLPGAEDVISYNMPGIRYNGKVIIGFDGHKHHIGIYPHSGSVVQEIPELESYDTNKGTIREKMDNLLPDALIEKIIMERVKQAGV